jgi:hypothetical protein
MAGSPSRRNHVQKLIAELTRLYLPSALPPDVLELRLQGKNSRPVSLAAGDGRIRTLLIPFRKMADGDEAGHWSLLCTVANALQTQLGLPAPAVSISGADGYGLWLSLEAAVSPTLARQFQQLLRTAYCPDIGLADDAALVDLPPFFNPASGMWAAFIHPGLGASFADESGLDMAPPFAGQAALLEGLQSIGPAQLQHALNVLQPAPDAAPTPAAPLSPGLLLKDATLEDIVNHLHSKNIEPTFRHLLKQ